MIEIAFDRNINNSFKGQEYPLLDVPDLHDKPFSVYADYAEKVLANYKSEKYLIAISDDKLFDANKLALAFFMVSCLDYENSIDCLVIKNENYEEAFERYKPYVAVSIGLKYALRLIKDPVDVMYRELKCLDYLGFSIKEDYVQNSICYMSHNSAKSSVTTNNAHDALVYASLYKILALAKIEIPFKLIVKITNEDENLDPKEVVSAVIQKVSSYIDI